MSDPNFPGHMTPYGFKWGPATVERMAELPNGLVIMLKTDAGRDFQIYVSAKGKSVRIHEKSVEWKPSE
jgi:hypothetical protein